MKKLALATMVAMTLSASAYAESTAVLKLQGVLTNDACTPELSGGGIVDFGTHYVYQLSATEDNQLGSKDFTLTINCTAPTKLAWTITDDRPDSKASVSIDNPGWSSNEPLWGNGERFGAGKTAGGVSIGAYALAMNAAAVTADTGAAKAVTSVIGTNPDSAWKEFGKTGDLDSIKSTSPTIGYTVADTDLIPVAFRNATFPMRVGLAVQDTTTLAITDETDIDGQATITLHYL
ncbi:DUF1120 domain-containing protein [Salmonella enterica]